jgi:hypothetical protein
MQFIACLLLFLPHEPLLHMGYSLRKFLSGVLSLSNGHLFDTVLPTLLRGLLLLLTSPATARDLQ